MRVGSASLVEAELRVGAGARGVTWDAGYVGLAGRVGVVVRHDARDDTYLVDFGESTAWFTAACLSSGGGSSSETDSGESEGSEEAVPATLPPPTKPPRAATKGKQQKKEKKKKKKVVEEEEDEDEEKKKPAKTIQFATSGGLADCLPVSSDSSSDDGDLQDGGCYAGLQFGGDGGPWLAASAVWGGAAAKHAERVLWIERDEAGKYKKAPYTIKTRYASYFAVAALDGKTAVDRTEARSFEHFALAESEDAEDDRVTLYAECVPPVCPKVVRRYIHLDAGTGQLVGVADPGKATPAALRTVELESCGSDCPEGGHVATQRKVRKPYTAPPSCRVVLFSTVKPAAKWSADDAANVRRSLHVWDKLPATSVYVFSEDHATRRRLRALGTAANVPDSHRMRLLDFDAGAVKVPTYRSLFQSALAASGEEGEADVLVYTNGDILFTPSLVKTVCAVKQWATRRNKAQPFMVVGRRFNHVVHSAGEGSEEEDAGSADVEASVESMRGKQWQEDAIDYFVVSKNIWDWSGIPEMVVGGTAFDNWVLQHALTTAGVIVVDATVSITAVHQTVTGESLYASHRSSMSEYNHKLGEKHGGWASGKVTQAPYITLLHDGEVSIHKRGDVLSP